MKIIETSILPFVEEQFPDFYKEEGELFILFVKAYYEWMEQTGNPLFFSRRYMDYVDIDRTISDFLTNFREKYITNFPFYSPSSNNTVDTTNANGTSNTTITLDDESRRALIKNAADLFSAKGNENALNLLFRLLFKEPANIFLPSTRLLKPSDGQWSVARYLEVEIQEKNKQMLGLQITGLTSGATGIVEKISRRMIAGNIFDVFYLTNIRGNFLFNEVVTHDGLAEGSPKTLGSVTSVLIENEGSGFEIGQEVQLISNNSGRQARARVTEVGSSTGRITYRLANGGFGYTANAEVYISSNVLFFDGKFTNDTNNDNFVQFEVVTQPMTNVPFTAATSTFANGTLVFGIDSGPEPNTTISAGVILISSQNVITNDGHLIISRRRVANISISDVNNGNTVTSSFIVGEPVYQMNVDTSSTQATGIVLSADSSRTLIDVHTGSFVDDVVIVGETSNCTATQVSNEYYDGEFTDPDISNIVTAEYTINALIDGTASDRSATGRVVSSNATSVGVYDTDGSRPFTNALGNYIIGGTTTVQANVGLISLGDPGGFAVGSLTDTETVFINTDLISDNNVFDEAYLSLSIEAEEYGFPKLPSGNLSFIIDSCLTKDSFEIGTIASITSIDPGSNNTAVPFTRIYEPAIAKHNRRNFELLYSSLTKPFVVGEQVLQTYPDGAITINITDASGTFNSTGRELLRQTRSDNVTVYGELVEQDVTSGAGTLRVRVSNTSNTFDTSADIVGTNSAVTATVTQITPNNYFALAKGVVISSNSAGMVVERKSFNASFTRSIPITGSISGASANVNVIYELPESPVIGNNAIVATTAGVLGGTLKSVEVIDSGIGYYDLEPVDIVFPDNPIIATGYVNMINEGRSSGYYKNTGGFLDSDKKLQDSNYYQEYSYEVQSGISLDNYASILKETLQVAGTKMFGKVIKASNVDVQTAVVTINRGTRLGVSGTLGSNGFVEGEKVTSSNANGTLTSYRSQVVLSGANDEFVVGQYVAQPSFNSNLAIGVIESALCNAASNTTTITINSIGGIFQTTGEIETPVNRKFIEYSIEGGTFEDGEVVYQSNGTANVGVGDLVSSDNARLVIKPLTELYIRRRLGTLTAGEQVVQTNENSVDVATGTIFSVNSSVILLGNTQGTFVTGTEIIGPSGNAVVWSTGGKTDQFTISDTVFVYLTDLSTVGFTVGEVVYQGDATATIVTANSSQLQLANIAGTFIAGDVVVGETSGTTATVSQTQGPFKIFGVSSGAVANAVTIESPYTNVAIDVISTINTLELSNVEGTFVVTDGLVGNSSGAAANVTTVEVLLY